MSGGLPFHCVYRWHWRPTCWPPPASGRWSDGVRWHGEPRGYLGAGGEAELGQNVFDVAFDGALRYDQATGDLSVAHTLGDQFGDLTLAPGQPRILTTRERLIGARLVLAERVGDGLVERQFT